MASCWAGGQVAGDGGLGGEGTSPSPGVQVTWAVQSAPQRFPLSTMYASQLLLYDSFHSLILVGSGPPPGRWPRRAGR